MVLLLRAHKRAGDPGPPCEGVNHEGLAHLVGERKASGDLRSARRGSRGVRDVDDVGPRIRAEARCVVVVATDVRRRGAGGSLVHVDAAPVRHLVPSAGGALGVHAREVPRQDLGGDARAGYADRACDAKAACVAWVALERDRTRHLARHQHAARDPAAAGELVDHERPAYKVPKHQSGVHRRLRRGHSRIVRNVHDVRPRIRAAIVAVVMASNVVGDIARHAFVHVDATAVGHIVSCAGHACCVQACKVPLESLCRVSREGHDSSHIEASFVSRVLTDSTAH
mmetsp:Transcript_40334/g.115537  ORF Transcript_40334/g.115537 Transcript_40334/m.115537 type:complete len:283 (+) Transcript_40334:533-1381(+)